MLKQLRPALYVSTALCAAVLIACSGGGGGREVEIVATDSGCSPTTIQASTRERLSLELINRASGDREIEGVEGTKLEEVLVPSGRTRKVNYTTPATPGLQKLKCYIPNGPSTIIEIQVSASPTD